LFGEPLYGSPLRTENQAQQEDFYQEALRRYEENPDDPEALTARTVITAER